MNKFDLLMCELNDTLFEIKINENEKLEELKEDLYLLSKDLLNEYVKGLRNEED